MRKRYVKQAKRLGRIEREILEELTFGDMAYGFLLSGHSTRRMHRLAAKRAKDRYRRKLALERLDKLGYIKGNEIVSITPTGAKLLDTLIEHTVALIGQKKWDRKWRIVAFDIPERLSGWRDAVRRLLKRAGFVQFQQSIWIFPHDCAELVQLIQCESKLSEHILYGVLERIEREEKFKKIFKLK